MYKEPLTELRSSVYQNLILSSNESIIMNMIVTEFECEFEFKC